MQWLVSDCNPSHPAKHTQSLGTPLLQGKIDPMMRFPDFRLPSSWSGPADEVGGRISFALDLATAASRVTLKYFRTDEYQVERKSDRSPVTMADKEAEQQIRTLVEANYPEDAILGEEFGGVRGTNEYEWIIDPIDGTKSFISGVPLYSTLVGLTWGGIPIAGVIAIPALGELVIAAEGRGAWYGQSTPDQPEWVELQPTRVSQVQDLAEGLFLVSQVDNFEKRGAATAYRALESLAYITRSWGDGYGYLLVATGRAELVVDPIVNPWDVAAVAPVILEAGGKFTSWRGDYDIRAGHCFASNGRVHAKALAELKPFA
jgi:histidinol phosphatase-like enzyme (inositol monophosphatase family)